MPTSKFHAMIHSKCPKCHVGNVFEGKVYSLRKQHMNEVCPHCGVKYEVEPGYFYAAMYVSYALSVAEIVSVSVAIAVLSRSESPWVYLAGLAVTILLFAPFNFRYARLILLHFLTPKISYDPRFELALEIQENDRQPENESRK
ncbi:DUF983 domain-containing protein [Sphingobacterium sp. InxBP1]|uniref:DUF983 domain-containing protein n=1 Tax=Sphingobacterium sp. InxBP1 TaxID=2870328 RepID=UPI0022442CD6|nr:DUF983 domain-containing protein [Sphingobacterium sp. InxBP1]MCW8310047.1 DUF983 domain-containing protein [Sphingobacterium sp. InxBP1]